MDILSLIIAIALLGFICWLVLQIPMPQPFKNIIVGIICFAVVIWILQAVGLLSGLPHIRLNK